MPEEHQSDHDILLTFKAEVTTKLEYLIQKVDDMTDDHEARIKSLENWRWYVVGIATIIAILAEFVINKYS